MLTLGIQKLISPLVKYSLLTAM